MMQSSAKVIWEDQDDIAIEVEFAGQSRSIIIKVPTPEAKPDGDVWGWEDDEKQGYGLNLVFKGHYY